MTHRAVTQTAWATWTFYSTPIPVSVSWPASPAKRDRMHLTHLSASSQVVIRVCQPQAARAFKKQMLQVHSSQFCCFFQHVSLFLIWATFTASHSSYLKFFSFYISDPGTHFIFLSSYACSCPVCFFHSTVCWFS